MTLVGDGGYWPALPVEGSVFEVGNLRRERRVNVEGEIWSKSQTKIAEECDLVGAAMTREEGVGRVCTPVGCEIVYQLLRELEPGRTSIGLLRILLVSICRAPCELNGTGHDAEDGIGHPRTIKRLLARVKFEILEAIRVGIILLKIQRKYVKHYVGLLHSDTTIHAGVFVNDPGIRITRDEDVRRHFGESLIDG